MTYTVTQTNKNTGEKITGYFRVTKEEAQRIAKAWRKTSGKDWKVAVEMVNE